MANRKAYTPLALSSFDVSALVAHLDGMAEKGWLFETIEKPRRFVFNRIEPRQERHCAILRPDLDREGPEDAPDPRELFLDGCEAQGWKWIAQYGDAYIFRAVRENAEELQTNFASCLPAMRERMILRVCAHLGVLVALLAMAALEWSNPPLQILLHFENNSAAAMFAALAIFLPLLGYCLLREILRDRILYACAKRAAPAPAGKPALWIRLNRVIPLVVALVLLDSLSPLPSEDRFFDTRALSLESLLGVEAREETLRQLGATALMQSGAKFSQSAPDSGQFLLSRHYNCRFLPVARRIFGLLNSQECAADHRTLPSGGKKFSAEECQALGISEGAWHVGAQGSLECVVRDGNEVLWICVSDLQEPSEGLLAAIRSQ